MATEIRRAKGLRGGAVMAKPFVPHDQCWVASGACNDAGRCLDDHGCRLPAPPPAMPTPEQWQRALVALKSCARVLAVEEMTKASLIRALEQARDVLKEAEKAKQ